MGNTASSAQGKKFFSEILCNDFAEGVSENGAGDASSKGASSTLSGSKNEQRPSSGSDSPALSLEDKMNSALNLPLTEAQLSEWLPLSSIRDLRYYRTKVFALLLYTCIKEIHKMALLRRTVNGEASPFLPQNNASTVPPTSKRNLSSEEISRFLSALTILRRCMPTALEDDRTMVETIVGEKSTSQVECESTEPTTANSSAKPPRRKTLVSKIFTQSFFAERCKCDDLNLEDRFPFFTINPSLREEASVSLSTALVWSLVECCFIRGLTLPLHWKGLSSGSELLRNQPSQENSTVQVSSIMFPSLAHNEVDLSLLWYEGVGSENPCKSPSPKALVVEKSIRRARREILHTLLITLSSLLFRHEKQTTKSLKNTTCTPADEVTYHQEELVAEGQSNNEPFSSSANFQTHHAEGFEEDMKRRKKVVESSDASSEPSFVSSRDTLFMEPLLSATTVPLMPTLAFSILNALLQYQPFGTVPYSSYFASGEEKVVLMGTRVLVSVLLYVGVPIKGKNRPERAGSPPAAMVPSLPHTRDESSIENAMSTAAQAPDTTCPPVLDSNTTPGERDPSASPANPDAPNTPSLPSDTTERNGDHTTDVPTPTIPPKFTLKEEELNFSSASPSVGEHSPTTQSLKFLHCVRKLFCEITMTESKFIISNIRNAIGLRTYAGQTYLPDSQKRTESQDEFFFLLWKLIDISPMVYQQFAFHPQALSYIIPIVEFALDVRKNKLRFAHHFQLGVFLLLRLSELRAFCLMCNKAVCETLPFSFPRLASGTTTYLEVIVIALCIFIEMKENRVLPVLSSCSFALANLAPYLNTLGAITSTRLAYTFAVVCTRWLRLSPQNPLCEKYEIVLINMCEAIASILQYNGGVGGKYMIAALIPYRALILVLLEVCVRQRRRPLSVESPTPFLIVTLDAALTIATPLVAGGPTAFSTNKLVAALLFPPNGSATFSTSTSTPSTSVDDVLTRLLNSSWDPSTPSPDVHSSSPPADSLDSVTEQTVTPSDTDEGGLSQSPENTTHHTTRAEEDGASTERPTDRNSPSGVSNGGVGATDADIRQTEEVAKQLSRLNLVGALPVPHKIFVKRLKTSLAVENWSSTTFWIGLHSCFPEGTFDDVLPE